MVKRIIGLISKEIKGLHEAAYILAFFMLSSQLLGLVRDRLLASRFGASGFLDIYYASFRIPDLLFVLVTFIVSGAILIPIFSERINNREEMKKIVDTVFSVFVILALTICIIIFIFIEPILHAYAIGFRGKPEFVTLVLYTRILLLSPILLGVSQLFGSIVQTYKHFFIYSISPILYNLGIIFGIVVFFPVFGPIGLIFGVVLGIILHVLVQIPSVSKFGLVPKLTYKIDKEIVKKIFLLSIPRSIALTTSQIILVVFVSLASMMTAGSIAVLNFAYNLQSVPMAIIGISYSLAAFPVLSQLFSMGNMEEFLNKVIISARHIIFWSLPVLVLFIVLRAQIVRTILGGGQFTWNDTKLVAASLAVFSISVVAQSLILLFVRGFYAMGQTRKPLFINITSSLIIIGLSFLLNHFYNNFETFQYFFKKILRIDQTMGGEVIILPLAFSIGMIINCLWLWFAFEKDFVGFSKNLWRVTRQILIASLGIGYISYYALRLLEPYFDLETLVGIFLQGLFAGLAGILFGILILIALKNKEVIEIMQIFKRKVWVANPVTEGQKEL